MIIWLNGRIWHANVRFPKNDKTTTTTLQLFYSPVNCDGTTQVSQYQKGKTNLDLLEQQTVSGSGISWAICKSAPCPKIIITHTHTQPFYGSLGFCPGLPGWAGTRKAKPIWIYWSKG